MSSALKRRVQPHADNFKRSAETDHSLSDGNDIGVVVLPSKPRGLDVPAQRATDAFYPIGRYRFAVAGAAQHKTAFKFAARDGLRHGPNEPRIIHRFCRMRAEIRYVVPQVLEQFLDFFLVSESGVIRPDGNFHCS